MRWQVGDTPIYLGDASPSRSMNLRGPVYVSVWCPDPAAVAAFVEAHVGAPAWVDPRRQDGSVLERDGFLADPQSTSTPW